MSKLLIINVMDNINIWEQTIMNIDWSWNLYNILRLLTIFNLFVKLKVHIH
jgi:hypothetical protein